MGMLDLIRLLNELLDFGEDAENRASVCGQVRVVLAIVCWGPETKNCSSPSGCRRITTAKHLVEKYLESVHTKAPFACEGCPSS
jgi:hypothetical protein